MAKLGASGDVLTCTFHGTGRSQARALIAGLGVYICDQCVGLSCELLQNEGVSSAGRHPAASDLNQFLTDWISSRDTSNPERVHTTQQLLQRLLTQLAP